MNARFWCMFCALLFGFSGSALAHEVKPALLEIRETQTGQYDVLWKQPVTDGRKLQLNPLLPKDCIKPAETRTSYRGAYYTERWTVNCNLSTGAITVEGLERSLTDIFVRIETQNGEVRSSILRPDANSWNLADTDSAGVGDYLGIGFEHMVFGPDHLLFVLSLTLLVALRQLFWVITSFTIAHSISLGITALGWIKMPSQPVEILIAMSIVLLAVELVRKRRGINSLSIEKPWLIAFVVGLIHGLGFAGALGDIGLPKGEEIWALFLFNVGLELGQLAFVAATLVVLWIVTKLHVNARTMATHILTYAIGGIGCFWVFDRLV